MTWHTFSTEIAVGTVRKPAIVLLDDRFATDRPLASLSRLVWIGVWNALPPDGHIWNPAETETLEKLEHALLVCADELANGWAAYVMCICTPGMQEYYFYAGEHAEFERLAERVKTAFPSYRIEQDEDHDPEWAMYFRYQRGLTNPITPLH